MPLGFDIYRLKIYWNWFHIDLFSLGIFSHHRFIRSKHVQLPRLLNRPICQNFWKILIFAKTVIWGQNSDLKVIFIANFVIFCTFKAIKVVFCLIFGRKQLYLLFIFNIVVHFPLSGLRCQNLPYLYFFIRINAGLFRKNRVFNVPHVYILLSWILFLIKLVSVWRFLLIFTGFENVEKLDYVRASRCFLGKFIPTQSWLGVIFVLNRILPCSLL